MNAAQHDDTTSIAIIETKVDALTQAVRELKDTLSTSTTVHVTRAEWNLRNQVEDERYQGLINDIRTRRAPWWSALAVILAAVALAWTIIGPSVVAQ